MSLFQSCNLKSSVHYNIVCHFPVGNLSTFLMRMKHYNVLSCNALASIYLILISIPAIRHLLRHYMINVAFYTKFWGNVISHLKLILFYDVALCCPTKNACNLSHFQIMQWSYIRNIIDMPIHSFMDLHHMRRIILNNTNTKGLQDIYPGTFVLLHLSHTLWHIL